MRIMRAGETWFIPVPALPSIPALLITIEGRIVIPLPSPVLSGVP